MYLNQFADTLAPLDMVNSPEFVSLLQSAADLRIPHGREVRYLSRQTVVRGLRFHFLEWGDPSAPAVLLLHGGNQSSYSWDLVSLHLSDRYHVFALDQRGHGDSEWSRELDYSIGAKAADALAFIEHEQLSAPVIVGHSMGGLVAMQMALSSDEVARGFVLVDTGPELSPKGVDVVHNFVVHNVEFDDLDDFLDNVAKYDRFRSREHIARTVKYNMMSRVDGKFVSKVDHRRVPDQFDRPLELDRLASLTCPILVIRGADSEILEAEAAERFVAALPNGQLMTVPDAGHNVHSANTRGFLDAIGPFLADLP
jgi:pimeloyl-ACP methyl ester carboxylesterase